MNSKAPSEQLESLIKSLPSLVENTHKHLREEIRRELAGQHTDQLYDVLCLTCVRYLQLNGLYV